MSNSTNRAVLIGRIPVEVKGVKGSLMDIYVNPNNITHVKPAIYPIYSSGNLCVHDDKPESYIQLGTMIFLTTPNTFATGNSLYGVNSAHPTSVFTNVKIESVVEILNGNKTYNDLKESDIYDIPNKDIRNSMGMMV